MASPTSDELLVIADGCLLLSHRLSELVSLAPTMEEDVAVGNVALDLLGQARGLLSHLGDEDQLAYFRDAAEFRNPAICELPNGDFAHVMTRQLFVDAWLAEVWPCLIATSDDEVVRGVAEKAIKENAYHLRHSSAWVVRLGDGTEESHIRMLAALEDLWPYRAELASDSWYQRITSILSAATLPTPDPDAATAPSGIDGDPSPDLLALLTEMQSLARAHPGATW